MSTKTEDALERLRMGITHFTGAVETADIRTALAEIERLQADVHDYRKTLDAWNKADRDDLRSARAAGYAAGQRDMRERAASTMDCDCPSTVTTCIFGDCSREDASNVRELPILPEPQESCHEPE